MPSTRMAVVRAGTSPLEVVTFVRADTPRVPEGLALVAEALLPPGWTLATSREPVPESVTRWQIRTWLYRSRGITPQAVSDLIDTIPDAATRMQARIDWDDAPIVLRAHPLLETLAASLGMSCDDVDQAFREAARLT